MTFDIDDDPVPDTIGEGTETEFDYITVADAGIITNTHGMMSSDMPEFVELGPSEYEERSGGYTKDAQGTNKYKEVLDPKINLFTWKAPIKSFDSGIVPDTTGSSLDPTTKGGLPIWDPENEVSMNDCAIRYDVVRLSPVVYLWKGRLSWTQIDLETEKYLVWDWGGIHSVVKTNHRYIQDFCEYRDIALHGINRYIQADIYVAFDVWTSLKLGALTEEYEYLKLYKPQEYYDTLIWSTIVGGWEGSTVEEYGQEWLDVQWWDDIVDFFGGGIVGVITLIILIIAIVVGLYLFIKIGVPLILARTRKKK
jgi:hypothetical protein